MVVPLCVQTKKENKKIAHKKPKEKKTNKKVQTSSSNVLSMKRTNNAYDLMKRAKVAVLILTLVIYTVTYRHGSAQKNKTAGAKNVAHK